MKSSPAVPPNVFTHLLARYMNGEIRDTAWNRFMEFMDSDLFSSPDRAALAAFFKDVLDEDGTEDIYIPLLSEASYVYDDRFRAAA